MISKVPPRVTEGGGLVLRKLGFGCMAATYVCVMLVVLLFFSLLLGIAFVSVWVEEPVIIRKPLYFDYTESNPSAIVPLVPYNREKVPGRRIIPAGHKFSAVVTFVMPQSDHNRHVGMFQVMAELISGDDKVLARSSQPCMLPFRSAPVQLAKTFLTSLPLLMGILGETETVVIHLIDYKEKIIPTESVKIILQPKALTSGLPELYSAEIDIRSQLPWNKEFSRKWKWTFCVWYTLAFYIFLVSLTVCFCKQVLLLRSTPIGKRDNKKTNKDEQGLHNVTIDSRMSEPGRRHSRNINKHVAFVHESLPISLQHGTMTSNERLGEHGERSEIVEESVTY
ncbi:seipin-1 isoform X2 [Cryptomeria japonica]|nr:seipin-1 isoform X2 [Cryptomeria japonica]